MSLLVRSRPRQADRTLDVPPRRLLADAALLIQAHCSLEARQLLHRSGEAKGKRGTEVKGLEAKARYKG